MSMRSWICERCQRPCSYLELQLIAGQEVGTFYGVAWGCSPCDYKALDVCPLGPLIPSEDACLNCGAAYPSQATQAGCPDCGLTRAAATAFLHSDGVTADVATVVPELFGRALFRRGLALLNESLTRDPEQEAPWLMKCAFLESLGLPGHVLRMLEGALAVGGPPSLFINHGAALQRAGRYEEAGAASRRYLDTVPGGPLSGSAHSNLGLALRALGRDEEAEESYREAIRLDGGNVLHYRNLAQLLADQRRWSGALGVLEAGLDRATTDEDKNRLLEGLAFVCAEEERGTQALEYIDRAIALGAASARAHYLRGRALALLGRIDEARVEIRGVLDLEPEHVDARQAMDMIDRALAADGNPAHLLSVPPDSLARTAGSNRFR
jgi:tetratricopeptide (TPR) repeat protein